MSGAIGAASGKFMLMGAALLLHGRVDDRAARVAIVPGAPTSAIGPDLADRLKLRGGDPAVRIHLRAESFSARIDAAAEPEPNADLRIGQDVLDAQPIEVDFARRDLQPLSPGEARRLERRYRPIAVRREAGNSLSVEIDAADAAPMRARLDLTSALGVAMPGAGAGGVIRIGGVALPRLAVTDGPQPVVGLYAFDHARVIFDLGHDRIWIGP